MSSIASVVVVVLLSLRGDMGGRWKVEGGI